MTTASTYILSLLTLFCLLSIASGCSLIGFGIGAAIDSTTPDTTRYSVRGLDSIKAGTPVTVIREDRSQVEGESAGLEEVPQQDDLAAYDRYRLASPLGSRMPAPGDSLCIVTRGALGRGEQRGRFISFSNNALRLHSSKYKENIGVLLEYIDSLYHPRGPAIAGDTLRRYVAEAMIPMVRMKTRMLLWTRSGTVSIPADEIREVRWPNSHNGKWWGLGIGAALDVDVIVAAVVSWTTNDWHLFFK